jgi:hypothetical protein
MSSAPQKIANLAKTLPLFASDKRRDVRSLCVRRFEDGRWVRAPQSFEPEEFLDRDAVRARFGGGRYEVIGRDGRQIVARTRFVLEGPPRPMCDAPVPEAARAGDPRAFATAEGSRARQVFELLNQGYDLVDVVERTELPPVVVRALLEDWLDLIKRSEDLAPVRDALEAMRRRGAEHELERSWTP